MKILTKYQFILVAKAQVCVIRKKLYMPLGEIRAVFLSVEYVSAFAADMNVGRKIAVS